MRKLVGFILTLIAVNSFAGKIPEAKRLHSELYTIQFTFARFPAMDSMLMTNKERNRAYGEYENLLEDIDFEEEFEGEDREMARSLLYGEVMDKALINHIESSKEVEYIDLATIYTRSGEPFPEAYTNVVKGLLDVKSKTLDIFEYNFPKESDNTKSTIIRLRLNKWYDGGWSQYGDWENPGYLLIKCYPPTNVPSSQKLDPPVKMSGDPVSEQGTAAERYTIQVTRLNYYELEYCEKEDLLTEKQVELLEEIKDKMRREIEKHQNLLEDLVDDEEIEEAESLFKWSRNKLQIKRAEVLSQGYTDTVTIYTRSGEPFSGERGIKGILDVESNKIIFTGRNDLFVASPPTEHPIYVNEWSYIANSIQGIDRSYLLVKYYPSANGPSSQPSKKW